MSLISTKTPFAAPDGTSGVYDSFPLDTLFLNIAQRIMADASEVCDRHFYAQLIDDATILQTIENLSPSDKDKFFKIIPLSVLNEKILSSPSMKRIGFENNCCGPDRVQYHKILYHGGYYENSLECECGEEYEFRDEGMIHYHSPHRIPCYTCKSVHGCDPFKCKTCGKISSTSSVAELSPDYSNATIPCYICKSVHGCDPFKCNTW